MGIFKKKDGTPTKFSGLLASKKNPGKTSVFGKVLQGAAIVGGTIASVFTAGAGEVGGIAAAGAIAAGAQIAGKAAIKTAISAGVTQAVKFAASNASGVVNNAVQKAITVKIDNQPAPRVKMGDATEQSITGNNSIIYVVVGVVIMIGLYLWKRFKKK